MDKQILTNSSMTTFKSCPRKYEIRYERGYESVEDGKNLNFGKLFHAALESWGNSGRSLDAALKTIDAMADEFLNLDNYDIVKARALMEGYHETYKDEPYEFVKAELEYRAPLLNPETGRESQNFIFGGVVDGILKDRQTGKHLIKETKTTSDDISPESDYWRKLAIDSQVSGYYVGAAAQGFEIETCLYDVIRKPSFNPFKATPLENRKYKKDGTLYANQNAEDETPDAYYARLKADISANPLSYYARKEIPRLQNDLEEYMADAWAIAQTIRDYQKRGKPWPRHTNSCFQMYGKCKFFDVCSGQATVEDTSRFKKSDKKHRELKGAA